MKIIHTGDLHLGSAIGNLPPDRAELRRRELTDSFARLAAYAKNNAVSAVLIAGDLFDGATPPAQVRKETLSIIAAAAPVCFFYVSGNHDGAFEFGETPDNFYTFSQARGWQSYDLPEGVTVTGIDEKYRGDGAYAALSLRAERFNILLTHGDIAQNGGVSLPNLQNKKIDYLALGHIHKPMLTAERLDGRGRYRYCGCLEGRGFDECGQRGCFLLEIQDGRVTAESFLSFASRTVLEVRADVSSCENYYDVERAALTALDGVSPENIIKLVLCGWKKVGARLDPFMLTRRLSERFFFVKVEDESRLKLDVAAFAEDSSEIGEFIKEVGRYEASADLREEILEIGLKALLGEEVDL